MLEFNRAIRVVDIAEDLSYLVGDFLVAGQQGEVGIEPGGPVIVVNKKKALRFMLSSFSLRGLH